MSDATLNYETLEVSVQNHIGQVVLNRPDKANSLDQKMWDELPAAFEALGARDDVRVIVLSGNGKHFCAGIDLGMFGNIGGEWDSAPNGTKQEKLRQTIKKLQWSFTAIERCRVPVIAAMHNACIGGAIDMVTACDLRYGSEDVKLSIKEIDIGMVADVGTLQRLPTIIGDAKMRELAYTGRTMGAAEAERVGLLNGVAASKEAAFDMAMDTAKTIAAKSPLSIRGTKEILRYTRDHGVDASLDYIATWNAGMLISEDLGEAFASSMEGRAAKFADS